MSRFVKQCPNCKRTRDEQEEKYDYDIEIFKCDVCKVEGCEKCMELNSAEFICHRCKKNRRNKERACG